jgi:hypothetical protein
VKMEVRTPYNYDRDEVSKNTALVCEDESLAQQNMKAETDLNVMIRKYGVLPAQEVNWQEFDAVRVAGDNDPEKFLAMVDAEKAAIKKQEKESAKADKGSVDPTPVVDADKDPE